MKTYNFQTEILKHEDMDAAYITFPYNVEEEFGSKGQVKVTAIFEGAIEYRGSLAKMGLDCHCLGITKEIREQIGKKPGDLIQVTLYKDVEPRIVVMPEDLNEELQKNRLEEAFIKLSYTKQKEHVNFITNSKKAETRIKRIMDVINSLKDKGRKGEVVDTARKDGRSGAKTGSGEIRHHRL